MSPKQLKWTSSGVDNYIAAYFSLKLSDIGFKKVKHSFVKVNTESRQEIFVGEDYSYGADRRIGAVFHSNIPIIHSVLACYMNNFGKFLMVERSSDLGFVDFEVSSFEELSQKLPSLEDFVHGRGIDFLLATESIRSLNETLNSTEGRAKFPSWDGYWGKKVGLIAAAICENPELDLLAEELLDANQLNFANGDEVHRIARDDVSTQLLVEDLRNGLIRNFDTDGLHPLLPPPFDYTGWLRANPEPPYSLVPNGSGVFGKVYLPLPAPDSLEDAARKSDAGAYQSIPLSGFDPGNEPQIRIFPEGHFMVVFEFMPPMAWEMDGNHEEAFAGEMAEAIGLEVTEEDRGFFLVAHPTPETVERVRDFVSNYRRSHGYTE
jgi:hypothetical protein